MFIIYERPKQQSTSFIKKHPCIFSLIICGIVIITVVVIVVAVVVTNKNEEEDSKTDNIINVESSTENIIDKESKTDIINNGESKTDIINNEESKTDKINKEEYIYARNLFPLSAELKSEVMTIYNNIGDNDNSTLKVFSEYLSKETINLKEEQKVFLAYYWIINNCKNDVNSFEFLPEKVFPLRTTSVTGFVLLFEELLNSMNYSKEKIRSVTGYSKIRLYDPIKNKPKIQQHQWNAVKIGNEWCFIDIFLDLGEKDEAFLCPSPECFIRNHIVFEPVPQFLEKPKTMEQFIEQINTNRAYCKYDMEIIEDKEVQNLCGHGKVIIKTKTEKKIQILYNIYEIPSYWVTKTNEGFEIDFYVNKKGKFQLFITLIEGYLTEPLGSIYYNCTEEPTETFYYPTYGSRYINSGSNLISPIQRDLTKGERYTFEIKTTSYTEMEIKIGDELIKMAKTEDGFKEENVYIHSDRIYMGCNEGELINFKGVGDDVDYPTISFYSDTPGLRLMEPILKNLLKGNTYKFELRCDTDIEFSIEYGRNRIVMDKNDNIYSKTITIDSDTTYSILYIQYFDEYDHKIYRYSLQ